MEDQQKIELYEKAFFIVKNSGQYRDTYLHLSVNGLDIFYTENEDILTVYYNVPINQSPVLCARKGIVNHIIDDLESPCWIDIINREYRAILQDK